MSLGTSEWEKTPKLSRKCDTDRETTEVDQVGADQFTKIPGHDHKLGAFAGTLWNLPAFSGSDDDVPMGTTGIPTTLHSHEGADLGMKHGW